MKRILLIGFLFLSVLASRAQNITIERLKNKLASAKSDTTRCMILDSLSMYNMFFNNRSDSTLSYCNEYINIAYKIPDKKYLILAYGRLSFYYNNTGLYKESLSMALKGLDLAEQYHIQDYLSVLYYDLSWFYLNSDDFKEGLISAMKGIDFLKFNKDPFFDQALHLYAIAGNLYLNINKIDSALFYFNRMDSIAAISTELAAKNISYWSWAIYYLYYAKDYQKTDSICSAAIVECRKYSEFLLNFFYLFSSTSYLSQGKIEKAIAEAREAYELSMPINDPAAKRFAANLLNTCYEKSGNLDSAYYYLKLKDSLDEQIQAHSNAIEIQQFRYEQQIGRKEKEAAAVLQGQKNRSKILIYVFLTAVIFFLVIAIIQWWNNQQKKKANLVLQQQKQKVESTLQELKSTQAQLIQNEKMASLGELTAGIAHEIQNPLNFVNNFSEVNQELLEELKAEDIKLKADRSEMEKEILNNLFDNSEKINHHGKRADAIVKRMLQHSRTGAGTKQPADINALVDEYLRLAYHGMRAKDNSFNVDLKTDFDFSIGKLNVVPQDIGSVLLNIYNNAFYAVNEKKKTTGGNYQPTVSVQSRKINDKVILTVKDNGNGIPPKIIDKIFQPFFTTKPAGQGTGLGLSLSYDMIKSNGGEIKVNTKENEGSEFIIEWR